MAAKTDDNYIPNSTIIARPAPSIPARATSLCERLVSSLVPRHERTRSLNLFTDPTYLSSHIIVCTPAVRWDKLGRIDTLSYENQHGCHKREGLLTCRFHPLPPRVTVIFAFADARFSIGSLVHPLPIHSFPRAPYVIEARVLAY